MRKSYRLDKVLNYLLLASEYDGRANVLPPALAERLESLIEDLEDECFHQAMEEEAEKTA